MLTGRVVAPGCGVRPEVKECPQLSLQVISGQDLTGSQTTSCHLQVEIQTAEN